MSLPGRTKVMAAALLGAGYLLCAMLPAQAATNSPALTHSNSTAAGAPVTSVEMPPLLLPDRSPIAFFRELLAMDDAERGQALGKYAPERQAQILGKLGEYESLEPDDRELRLRVTELRWYLQPLMAATEAERADRLARIPEPNRSLLKARLLEWDKVPADVRRELLGMEPTLQYFAEIKGRSAPERQQMLNSIPSARREMLEKGLQKWYSMSGEQRQHTLDRFNQFFELTGAEKRKALMTLSEPERRQIEKTLQAFGSLPQEQRAWCIRCFDKFTSLSLEERQEFLKNAERWKLMPPSEREAWRQLVNYVPPPLPPMPPPPPPPIPSLPDTQALATNRN